MHLEYTDDESMKELIENLAERTAKYPYEYCKAASCEALSFSPATYIDSAVYAYFTVSEFCHRGITDADKALLFREHYLLEFVKHAKALFATDTGIDFEKLFTDRGELYRNTLKKMTDINKDTAELLGKFELTIKRDIIGISLPLGAAGAAAEVSPRIFMSDTTCHTECQAYHESLSSLYSRFLWKLFVVM